MKQVNCRSGHLGGYSTPKVAIITSKLLIVIVKAQPYLSLYQGS